VALQAKGGLHEKHAVAAWNLGTVSAFLELRCEIRLNNIQTFNSYRTENTLRIHYTDQPVNVVREIIAVFL
jgi:hypothetical protein